MKLLMAFSPDHDESEPVTLERLGDVVVLTLDNGDELHFDRVELEEALDEELRGGKEAA